ncbi:CpaF family protein [Neobacillus massiliamazoniensis]|uniref:Type II secretion system protein, putative n=1 Tax=Neobacillus massiliamazoniensis TaxID=1499688 RepID=A0A0U1NU03_9BACI|nr:CpaF family protein [Neobacillus massiliamazoniensis]CRK81539.1 type II secretion system protein, putative [Neobacillus massiliamazoniensis]
MSLFKRYREVATAPSIPTKDVQESPIREKSQEFWNIEASLHNYLLEELKKYPGQNKEQEKKKIVELGEAFFNEEGGRLTFEEKQEILEYVKDELLAYGPITPLLENPLISEVMVNSYDEIYYEENGKIARSNVSFMDNQHVMRVIERIVSPIGRRVDESSPMVDARLPDGSRVNAIIPPLALKGPSLTIRKFSDTPFTIKDLIRFGTLSEEMAEFLDICVKSRLNIFISGGTGSGKTSTLNVLSSFIPNRERIITIEDAAELKLHQEHIVSLESRPANIEEKGQISIRDLVRNSLRMRPDRIVVGEVRGAEALDMLQAMNTGHDGSLSTGHANSPRDILSRLETMVLMAGYELPVRAIREQIANAIDLIVHQSRMKDGTRKITHITEVLGMEGDTIVLQDLFLFKEKGHSGDGLIQGSFTSTGIRPKFTEQLELNGYSLPSSWFVGEWFK